MFIYIITLVYLIILIRRYDLKKRSFGYVFNFLFSLLLLILTSGLRYKIGSDTLIYMEEYPYMPDVSSLSKADFSYLRYDLLWIVFCSVCKSISSSFFFMQFVHALIINVLFFIYIYKNTEFRFTGIMLYYVLGFLYFNTEIMRESMSVAVFLFGIQAFMKKKWLRYYLIALVSVLFHSSALVTFFFPLINLLPVKRFFYLSLFSVAIASSAVWTFFNDYIQFFYVFSSIESKAISYLQNNDAFVYNFSGIVYGVISYVLTPLLCVFFYKKRGEREDNLVFVWLFIALGIFVVFNNTVFLRFQNYLFFPFIIFVTNYFKDIFSKNVVGTNHILKISLVFFLLLLGRYYNYFKPDRNGTAPIYQRYIPYQTVFTNETAFVRKH